MPTKKENKRVIDVKTMWLMLFDCIPFLRVKRTDYINKEGNLVIYKTYWLFAFIPLCSTSREYTENMERAR